MKTMKTENERIGLKGYKIFKNYSEIEIKPITILTGKNNSGKSTFLNLFSSLFNDGKYDFRKPFSEIILRNKHSKVNEGQIITFDDCEWGIKEYRFCISFPTLKDFIFEIRYSESIIYDHHGQPDHIPIEFIIDPIAFKEKGHLSEYKVSDIYLMLSEIKKFKTHEDRKFIIDKVYDSIRRREMIRISLKDIAINYLRFEEFSNIYILQYLDSLCDFLEFNEMHLLKEMIIVIKSSIKKIYYKLQKDVFKLSAYRGEYDTQISEVISQLPQFIKYKKQNEILNGLHGLKKIGKSKNDNIEVSNKINYWLNQFEIGEELILKDDRIPIIKKDDSLMPITEKGFGNRQLLPIIFLRYFNDKIVLVEEPESHLHPYLQSTLADFFVECYISTNSKFIIETHSEYLIRKLQFLVAKKTINSNDVGIYYFDNGNIKNLEIREDGILSNDFNPGFFDEALKWTIDLLSIQNSN